MRTQALQQLLLAGSHITIDGDRSLRIGPPLRQRALAPHRQILRCLAQLAQLLMGQAIVNSDFLDEVLFDSGDARDQGRGVFCDCRHADRAS